MNPKYPTVVHEWFEEVWNKGQAEAVARLLAADAIVHGLEDEVNNKRRGPAAFLPVYYQFKKAFADVRIEVADYVSQGDKVAVRCVIHCTHCEEIFGVQPTHKPLKMTGMVIAHIKNGQIGESWNQFDFSPVWKQG